jgi:nucleotide-binding universal stress UspA family protein
MKTILVLTDFSPSARNAAEAAIQIAGAIHAEVVLLNTYVIATMTVNTEPMPWPLVYYKMLEQDSIDLLKLEKERLLNLMADKKNMPGNLNLSTLSCGGYLAENVRETVLSRDVQMIFMGARHNRGVELLFGSDIKQVVRKANRPVFIIPDTKLKFPLNNVLFATDLSNGDLHSFNFLATLANELNFHIEICHVKKADGDSKNAEQGELLRNFKASVERIEVPSLSFKALEAEGIRDKLVWFAHKKHIELMVLTHQEHSFLWRLFHETPATDLMGLNTLPLLILTDTQPFS